MARPSRSTSSGPKVREWLAAHVPKKTPDERFLQWDDEGVARDRAIQRSLWEGGITGVTVPVEYGGLGLDPGSLSRRSGRRRPTTGCPRRYGNAFNVVLPTLLAHASEELKQRVHPAHPQRRHTSGASSCPNRAAAPTWPGCSRGPSATVTPGGSTAPRSGPPGATTPTTPSAWPGPTLRCPSTPG